MLAVGSLLTTAMVSDSCGKRVERLIRLNVPEAKRLSA